MNNKKKRIWSKNRHILKTIPNPSKEAYEIKMKIPELTFEGVRNQPDFGQLYITFYKKLKLIVTGSCNNYIFFWCINFTQFNFPNQ